MFLTTFCNESLLHLTDKLLPSATKLWRLCFTGVCHSVHEGGGPIPACIAGSIPACLAAGGGCYSSMHRRWYPSMPCSWGCYPSMHCRWYPNMPCSGRRGGLLPRRCLFQGVCSGGCLLWGGACSRGVCSRGCLLRGGSAAWGCLLRGGGVETPFPPPPSRMPTVADGTHPAGMHSCYLN